MKKKLIITAALLVSLASCTYTTTNSSYSAKGGCVPIVRPAPVVVQPAPIVVRPVYYNTVVEPPIFRRTVYTYTPYGVYCD